MLCPFSLLVKSWDHMYTLQAMKLSSACQSKDHVITAHDQRMGNPDGPALTCSAAGRHAGACAATAKHHVAKHGQGAGCARAGPADTSGSRRGRL